MLLIFLYAFTANARDLDGPGPRIPKCKQEHVEQCKREHQSALDALQSRISVLSATRESVSREREGFDRGRREIDERLEQLSENFQLNERERIHLEKELSPEKKNARAKEEIPLTDLFSLSIPEQSWLESLPLERLGRLRELLEKIRGETLMQAESRASIHAKIQSLDWQLSSLSTELARLNSDAASHAKMCNGGCEARHCGTD